ncbi:MAG: metallophosphoesterase family protein [Pseudomonadota bacterium]
MPNALDPFTRELSFRLRALRRRFDDATDYVRDLIEKIDLETRPVSRMNRVKRVSAAPPGTRIYAVGDIHGRADLLLHLMSKIRDEITPRAEAERVILIFLGDYIDRGFQSRKVIEFLVEEAFEDIETVFLKGNHEDALLRFLSDPTFGSQWAHYGGAETLASYGVKPPTLPGTTEQWREVHAQFTEAFPDSHRKFLETLEIVAQFGDYVFVHAGLRPGAPVAAQKERDMLWIREQFLADKTPFEQMVVHGHTPIEAPYHDHRRIGVDTGAYLSGKLTAVRLIGERVEFISTDS